MDRNIDKEYEEYNDRLANDGVKALNERIQDIPYPWRGQVSDGYHTFDELYEHRITLYIQFCKLWENWGSDSHWKEAEGRKNFTWRSRVHSDGSVWEGWFVLGIQSEKAEQITYHIPEKYWLTCDFADTLDKVPEWDGHTSADVLERLKKL